MFTGGVKAVNRLMNLLSKASKKVSNLINRYNDIPSYGPVDPPYHLVRKDVLDLESSLWNCLISSSVSQNNFPYAFRRKLVDAMNMKKRASEEIDHVQCEMIRLMENIQAQKEEVEQKLADIRLKDSFDRTDLSQMGMLNTHVFVLSKREDMLVSLIDMTCNKNATRNADLEAFLQTIDNLITQSSIDLSNNPSVASTLQGILDNEDEDAIESDAYYSGSELSEFE